TLAVSTTLLLYFSTHAPAHHLDLHSFPTRRSSDLGTVYLLEGVRALGGVRSFLNVTTDKVYENREWEWGYRETDPLDGYDPYSRSEEHTSELQSRFDLVCRLLLEKKKKQRYNCIHQ